MKSNQNLGQRGQPAIYFRRIVIFASEDVGLADPETLPLAIATRQAIEFVGLPEIRILLARATAYMCRAKKSSEAYVALGVATEEIECEQTQRVPERLKNKHFSVNPEARAMNFRGGVYRSGRLVEPMTSQLGKL